MLHSCTCFPALTNTWMSFWQTQPLDMPS
jgi:hypothetical protein